MRTTMRMHRPNTRLSETAGNRRRRLAAACAVEVLESRQLLATNGFGDTFVTQWTEDFTKETTLNTSRWSMQWGTPAPTFDATYGMKLNGCISTTPAHTIPYDPYGNYGNTDPAKAYLGTVLFGRYSARIYNDPTSTQNQSIWMVKPVYTNDDWNEIDLETYQSAYIQPNTVIPTYSLHWGDWNPVVTYPTVRDATVVTSKGWHDWTIDWTPNYIAWYRDGTLQRSISNDSTKPGWTELTGSGVESQLFRQSLMFANQGTGGTGGGNPSMAISSASYSALQLQSFAAAGYSGHVGGVVAVDSKNILPTAPGTGNQYVGSLKAGDYLKYSGVQTQWRNISIQVDATAAGRDILVRTGSPTGPIIGSINVPVTRGPEWVYTDLKILSDPKKVSSVSRPFNSGNASKHVGKKLVITGGNGFTAGTYTVTAVDSSGVATLDRAAGAANSVNGAGTLQYDNPIRYTLASANLVARTGAAQDIYLTQTGGDGGVNLYNVYFFGTQPTSVAEPTPFGGVARAVPGHVNASDYDNGGAGVAYNVHHVWNDASGLAYRADAVNLGASGDVGGGLDLANTYAGNWYKYTVNVATAGVYTVAFRVNAGASGSFHLEDEAGTNLTGAVNVTSTGWAYTTLNASVVLPAGQQIITLRQDTTGGYNFHGMDFARAVPTPFGGVARAVPGHVNASDYDNGGSGVAYNVHHVWNDASGLAYRADAVNLGASGDAGGGLDLANTYTGNWYKYTVNVATAGVYTVAFRVNAGASGSFHLENEAGTNLTGAVNVTNTGWAYTTLNANVVLPAGQQIITLCQDTTGGYNFHGMDFARVVPTPFGGVARAVPGHINASDYDNGGSGVAYNVHHVWNDASGLAYRTDAVNLGASGDAGGGLDLANTYTGNWYKYTVNIATAGAYTVAFRVNAGASGSFHLENEAGTNLTGAVNVTSTGWAYTTLNASAVLPAGQQIITLRQDTTGGYNFHGMDFALVNGNVLTNPGFESGNLTGWTKWAPPVNGNLAASYKDSYGGGHTGSYHLTHYSTSPYSIQTQQVVNNLPNGTYTLTAWVKSSGGFSNAFMYAWRYNNPDGGTLQTVGIPTSPNTWVQITIPNIVVTSGMIEIGFRTEDTVGSKWLYVDDVVLTKVA